MNIEEEQVHSWLVCQSQGENEGERMSPHDDKTIKELVTRMNRIEGQIRGIKGMIESEINSRQEMKKL